jgi:acetyltransferase-like isoleucine patch superfamily enzyme
MIEKAFRRITRLRAAWYARSRGVSCGLGVVFHGMPIISMEAGSSIVIGDRASVISDSRFTALGVSHPVVLRTLRTGAAMVIGADVGMSGTSICAAHSITIGDQTMIGADVMIADTDFHPLAPTGRRFVKDFDKIDVSAVNIGKNVFIGAKSIVLKGVTIGDNSVIGAGSVVSKDIPPGCIAAGNPCRVIRTL